MKSYEFKRSALKLAGHVGRNCICKLSCTNSAVQTQLCKLSLKPSFMGRIEPLPFNRSVYCGLALWFESWMNTILPKCRLYRR